MEIIIKKIFSLNILKLNQISLLFVSTWASIQKTTNSIPPYNYFPGFPHKRFLWNMMVRVTGNYIESSAFHNVAYFIYGLFLIIK